MTRHKSSWLLLLLYCVYDAGAGLPETAAATAGVLSLPGENLRNDYVFDKLYFDPDIWELTATGYPQPIGTQRSDKVRKMQKSTPLDCLVCNQCVNALYVIETKSSIVSRTSAHGSSA